MSEVAAAQGEAADANPAGSHPHTRPAPDAAGSDGGGGPKSCAWVLGAAATSSTSAASRRSGTLPGVRGGCERG